LVVATRGADNETNEKRLKTEETVEEVPRARSALGDCDVLLVDKLVTT
jgi:hypothetical protein